MSDNDLIRRGDAIRQADRWVRGFVEADTIGKAITTLPAVDVKADPRVKVLEGGWEDVMQAAIARFDVAAAVGGTACWNSVGSRAMAELLKELCRHVDAARAALPAVDPLADPRVQALVEAEREAIAVMIEAIIEGAKMTLTPAQTLLMSKADQDVLAMLASIVAAIRARKGDEA